jgi:hypothetical protein
MKRDKRITIGEERSISAIVELSNNRKMNRSAPLAPDASGWLQGLFYRNEWDRTAVLPCSSTFFGTCIWVT